MTATQRALRTLLQLIVAGGLTALVDQLANGLAPATAGLILAAWQVVVTLAQNALEDAGTIPPILGKVVAPPAPTGPVDVETEGGAL